MMIKFMRKTKYSYIFPIITAVVFTLLSACVNTNGTNASHETEAERNQMVALDKAGVTYINFTSDGMVMGGKYMELPERNLLYFNNQVVVFGKDKMQFLYRENDEFTFYNPRIQSQVRISFDTQKGRIQAFESSSYVIRTYESRTNIAAFQHWVQLFTDVGFSQNRLGFIRDIKFIDGSKTELKSDETNAIEVEVSGKNVFWDKELVTLSIVVMKDDSLAIQLLKQNKKFWLYGGGNFQISESDSIETTYVGSNCSPSGGFNFGPKTPAPYSSLYPKLKALAQSK